MVYCAVLAALLLPHNGHWFGGTTQTVRVQVPPEYRRTDLVLTWKVEGAGAPLAAGELPVPAGGVEIQLPIELPEVRARFQARFSYGLRDAQGAEIEHGEAGLFLYAKDTLSTSALETKALRPAVLDNSGEWAAVLHDAGVKCEAVRSLTALQVLSPNLVLIGQEALPASSIAQSPIRKLAAGGARIIIMAQSGSAQVAGHALKPLRHPTKLDWREGHPLLADLSYKSLLDAAPALATLHFATAKGLDRVGWRTPIGDETGVDALFAAEHIGHGWMIFCQMPVSDIASDPRGHTLLRNLIWYATRGRPAETARSARRADAADDTREIHIPSGVKP